MKATGDGDNSDKGLLLASLPFSRPLTLVVTAQMAHSAKPP